MDPYNQYNNNPFPQPNQQYFPPQPNFFPPQQTDYFNNYQQPTFPPQQQGYDQNMMNHQQPTYYSDPNTYNNYQQPQQYYPQQLPQTNYNDFNYQQPSFPNNSFPPQQNFQIQQNPSYDHNSFHQQTNYNDFNYHQPTYSNNSSSNLPPQQNYQPQQSSYGPCTGNKKALLIGINYFGTQSELKGCINDVKNIKAFLLKNGFRDDEQHIRMLTDDQRVQQKQPTRANIIEGMKWLVQNARPGDSLFFHFSGHGSQQRDTNGDEDDGFDETICPVDYKVNGMIVDDLMHKILVQSLPNFCRLTFIADCCHSGTALDLPYVYDERGLTNPNKINQSKVSQADVIGFSGCLDSQTSSDTVINNMATGAMSYAFIKALTENPKLTFKGLLSKMKEILNKRNKFTQIPQMSSSHSMDMNYPWII